MDNENNEIVEFIDKDGEKTAFEIVKIIVYQDGNYAILHPVKKMKGFDEDACFIFEIKDVDEDNVDLVPVDDDDVMDAVYDLYVEWAENVEKQGCGGNCGGCNGCN